MDKINTEKYLTLGFKDEKSYNAFLELMNKKIIFDRSKFGFVDDDRTYDNLEMMEKIIELEIYKSLDKCMNNRNFTDAWKTFSIMHNEDEMFIDNKSSYKNIFKKIYINKKKKIWNATDVINFIKSEERKMKREVMYG